jgi:Cysteine-rich domain
MRVGLFIPCYMDAFEPEVGIATLELLERLGCTVEYPVDQTCCGQPMTNTGCHQDAAAAEALFVKNFSGYDFIVAPSGSCVHQVRVNMTVIEQTPEVRAVRERTFELTASGRARHPRRLHGFGNISQTLRSFAPPHPKSRAIGRGRRSANHRISPTPMWRWRAQ